MCAPGVDRPGHLDAVVMFDNVLDRHNGVGPVRHRAAGRDLHRLARRRAAARRARPAAIRKTTGNVPGTSAARIAKPSIAELGNGGRSITRRNVLRQHAARRLGDRDRLGLERPDPREHARAGLRRSTASVGASGTYANGA